MVPGTRWRYACGLGVTAEIADSLGQLKQWRRMGVCPLGDQVRQAVGNNEKPLSSTKTSVALSRRAFFYPRPGVLDPAPDRFLVSLAGATGGLLPTPAKAMEQATHMIAVIANTKALPEQVGDPLRGPDVGGEAVGRGPLRQQAGQLAQLRAGEFRLRAGMLATRQTPQSGASISAPPSPNRLPACSQPARDLGFGLPFANPGDGLVTASFQSGKISLATLRRDHALRSHRTIKISSYLYRDL